jgi:hypothetical protein
MTTWMPHPNEASLPEYHSKLAYSIPADQADAIVRMSAYHRKDFDSAAISFPPRIRHKATSELLPFRKPQTSLGKFDGLPLELINEICLQVDIKSVPNLRVTNARARQVLDALHKYQIVTKHAQDPLRALIRTQSASRVTLQDFHLLLCTQGCSLCSKHYGESFGYAYLNTMLLTLYSQWGS